MKVGDLVKMGECAIYDSMDHHQEATWAIVVQDVSHGTRYKISTECCLHDGELWWMDTQKLRVVNEAG